MPTVTARASKKTNPERLRVGKKRQAGAVQTAHRAAKGKGSGKRSKTVTVGGASAARLPGWNDLAVKNSRDLAAHGQRGSYLEAISTVRFAIIILVVAAAFTLYVGHVHATQDLLADLQQNVIRENQRLHLKYNRLKGEFDQATGPAIIYQRARRLGLVEGATQGPVITVE